MIISKHKNYILEYYEYIKANEDEHNEKIKTIYKYLAEKVINGEKYEFYNNITEEKEEHEFVFDIEKATRPILFIEKFCKHSKGRWAGKNIELELWQKAFIQALFGFVDKETRLRQYKKGILFVARKNGKSTLDSGLANYMLMKDGELGSEVYSIATKKEQAKIVWEEAKRMINKSPDLSKRCRCLVGGIYYDETESFMKALASDSNSLDGLNTHFGIADEVHAWKDKNLLDVIFDSMSAREQPMVIETSTMGTVRGSVFDNEYDYCEDIIKGIKGENDIKDLTVLPIIYELDTPIEWQNEKMWKKANPRFRNYKINKRY